MKPNLFRLATKELSQDALFTWILQWSNPSCNDYNSELCGTAQKFVKFLIQQQHDISTLKLESVSAGRQWKNIDIWVEVNSEYFIAIEDKTTSDEHSDQLIRYKEIVTQEYPKHKNVFIYLKTGNESLTTLNKIKEKGYAIIDRRSIINIFKGAKIENDIFNDFVDLLEDIENETSAFNSNKNIVSNWRSAEGFFLQLQEINLSRYKSEEITNWVSQIGDWRYVSNPAGGFLGYWYHWTETKDFCLNIQIENAIGNYNRLVVKVSEWEPNTRMLYIIFGELQKISTKYGLNLVKPDRFNSGVTSTVAVIENAFPDELEIFDFEKFISTLTALEQTLTEYCENYG